MPRTQRIIIDKIMTVKRERLGEAFGRIDDETMIAVNQSMALFLGFA